MLLPKHNELSEMLIFVGTIDWWIKKSFQKQCVTKKYQHGQQINFAEIAYFLHGKKEELWFLTKQMLI